MIRRIAGRARALRRAGLALIMVGWSIMSAPAMTLLPVDLPALTDQAARIFVGRVERVERGRDARGLPAVWTTFHVEQPLKGPRAERITVKQLGAAFGGPAAPVVPRGDVPAYRRGEEVLLFVHGESTLGFTSPVGLGQGCFRISERDGRRVAENDVGNRNLAAVASNGPRAATAPTRSGPEPLLLDPLVERVRALVGPPH